MKIVLASRNKKKIGELRALLSEFVSDVEILSLDDVGMTEEIEENGATFAENALIKARAAATSGYIGVGDDSGLAVDALGGEPGIYSARYAERCGLGDNHNDDLNNQALLSRMEGLEGDARSASFVCCIACVLPDGREFTVERRAEGTILKAHSGKGGFGYDPLFYYAPMRRTFAELTAEEKNEISHRGLAIRAFADALKQEIEKSDRM